MRARVRTAEFERPSLLRLIQGLLGKTRMNPGVRAGTGKARRARAASRFAIKGFGHLKLPSYCVLPFGTRFLRVRRVAARSFCVAACSLRLAALFLRRSALTENLGASLSIVKRSRYAQTDRE